MNNSNQTDKTTAQYYVVPMSGLYISKDATNQSMWTVCESRGDQPNAEQVGVGYSIAVARFYDEQKAIQYIKAVNSFAALKAVADSTTGFLRVMSLIGDEPVTANDHVALKDCQESIAAALANLAAVEKGQQ